MTKRKCDEGSAPRVPDSNASALGKLSTKARKKRLGEEGYNEDQARRARLGWERAKNAERVAEAVIADARREYEEERTP